MLSVDPNIPDSVFSIQKWFGSIIARPIDDDSQMLEISPTGRPISEEASEFIKPSPTLTSSQRIQIYNQQYWWRLLTLLQEAYPTLTRLFGYTDFNNSLATPYLNQYPSRHWSLSYLGDRLPVWILENYQANDKHLALYAAQIDWAFQEVFFAPPPISLSASIDLLTQKLKLQDHIKIFKLPYDLFNLRVAMMKESVEYWMEHDFPVLAKEKTYHFILYRNQWNQILHKEIEESHWNLLNAIEQGYTIEEACDQLESAGGEVYAQAQNSLSKWVQEWLKERWIKP